jgi:hypothetical protein
MPIDRAIQIDNWVARPGWIEPRKGYQIFATGLSTSVGHTDSNVSTIMAYNSIDGTRKLFGVAGTTIFDCTAGGGAAAIPTSITSLTSSRLQYVLFANPGNSTYLIGVNGADNPVLFDGTTWTQPSIYIGNAYGSITWSQNMINGESINLNGTIVTFVTGSPSGNQVQILGSLQATLTSLVTFLNSSIDMNISQCLYSQSLGNILNITYKTSGYMGNEFTLAAGYATGNIVFGSNPNNGDTITLQGTSVTFVTSFTGGNQVMIGSSLANTLAALYSSLEGWSNSNFAGFTDFTYSTNATNTLYLQSSLPGELGNTYLIAASAATASGSTLTGGSSAALSGTKLANGGLNYGITPSNFVQVNSYMNRLWFVPINSTDVVYLSNVGGVSGAASVFPLGQLLKKGGYIQAIGTWTVDTRQNVDEYIAFISSRGEILVYQGTDPTTSNTFALTGIYQIGTPIGRRCFLRIAGDLQVITVDGVVGMSEMLSTDRAAANRVSLTSIIMNEINKSAQLYKNNFGWQIIEYPLQTLTILNIPVVEETQSIQYVMNTITGAWSRWIGLNQSGNEDFVNYGMNAICWEMDAYDNIYFGDGKGNVNQWNVNSSDAGKPITCLVQSAYNSFGNAAQLKRYTMLQPLITTTGFPIPSVGINVDFSDTNILSTPQPISDYGAQWDTAIWDNFNWSGAVATTNAWTSVQGIGHYVSIVTQVITTSSSTDPALNPLVQLNGWNILAESGAFV